MAIYIKSWNLERSCAVSRPQKRAGTHRGCEPGEPALPQLLCMKVSENGTITKTAQTNTQDSGALATLLGRCVINPPHTNLNTTGHQGKQRNFCNDPTLSAATTWVPCLCFSWGTRNFCCRPLYSQLTSFRRLSMPLIESHGLETFLRILDLETSQPHS